MKILDRYIYRSLLLSSTIFVVAILGFYIVVDMFSNFHNILRLVEYKQEADSSINLLWFLLAHYATLSPLLLYTLAPLIALIAAMFVITKMEKSRELLLLKASGISIYRTLRPFGCYAAIICLAMVSLQEIVIPTNTAAITDGLQLASRDKRFIKIIQHCDRQENFFFIERFYIHHHTLENVRIIPEFYNSITGPQTIIEAKRGEWQQIAGKRVLVLYDGEISSYPKVCENPRESIEDSGLSRDKIHRQKLPATGYIIETSLAPHHVVEQEETFLQVLSTKELYRRLRETADTTELEVTIYNRFTAPLSPFVLLLIGLPMMLNKEVQNFFIGVGLCMLFAGGFYLFNIFCLNLGYRGALHPLIAAWLPIVVFGSLSVSFIQFVKT